MQVISSAATGHKVRCKPSLKANTVGTLALDDTVYALEYVRIRLDSLFFSLASVCNSHQNDFFFFFLQFVNRYGTWVKLDNDAAVQYCFDPAEEAWSLFSNKHGVAYMEMLNRDDYDDDSDDMERKDFYVTAGVRLVHKVKNSSNCAMQIKLKIEFSSISSKIFFNLVQFFFENSL